MKTPKAIYILISGVVLLILAIIAFIGVATLSSHNYKYDQDEYFSKVEYVIEGKVIGNNNVGGNYYIIKLRPTKFTLPKNRINDMDDHVGVFAKDTSMVIVIAALPEKFTSPLKRISINTQNRQTTFNDSMTNTLRTAGLYKHKLPRGTNYVPF